MNKYQVILDVWEGSLDIDEAMLSSVGIAAIIVRLNDMNGGHHKDMTFDSQWSQAVPFLRAPYFVYNPWVSGLENYRWLEANLPDGVTRLFVDIEVTKPDYPPSTYAVEVASFIAKIKQLYPLTTIYTGGWFINILSFWVYGSYWWARYPFMFYPPKKENWTWEQLKTKLDAAVFAPDPDKKCPGVVDVWQLTGDRLILPGCADRPMDISVWNGDYSSLKSWWGNQPLTLEQKVDLLYEQAKLHQWSLP
jgi:hypothetical protein